jgi:hypothetical protein
VNNLCLADATTLKIILDASSSLQSDNASCNKVQCCSSGSCRASELQQEVFRLSNENADLKLQLLAAKARSPEVTHF